MSVALQNYLTSVMIVALVDLMAAWGLNLQFGLAGINNFAFIVFQAIGAYVAGVLSLGPAPGAAAGLRYLGGASLPFPLPLIGGTLAAGLIAVPVGLILLRRLRGDYEAMVLLIFSLIATGIANADLGLVNGPAGLYGITAPLQTTLPVSLLQYQWVYVVWCVIVAALVFWACRAITRAPLGRTLRALRDNESVVVASGRNVSSLRLQVFVVGSMIAGLSGAVLVEFIGAWAPSAWLYPETFVLITAIVVGGRGNLTGVALGTLLIPVALLEATRFLPGIGYAGLIDSLEWVLIGAVTLGFLVFRPKGFLPERPRRFVEGSWRRGAG